MENMNISYRNKSCKNKPGLISFRKLKKDQTTCIHVLILCVETNGNTKPSDRQLLFIRNQFALQILIWTKMLSTASWKKNSWSTCQSVIISDIGIREPDVGIDIQRKMKSFHIFWLITNCYTWFLIKFTDIHSPICVNKGTDINLPVLVVIWHVSLLNFHCDEIQLIY